MARGQGDGRGGETALPTSSTKSPPSPPPHLSTFVETRLKVPESKGLFRKVVGCTPDTWLFIVTGCVLRMSTMLEPGRSARDAVQASGQSHANGGGGGM